MCMWPRTFTYAKSLAICHFCLPKAVAQTPQLAFRVPVPHVIEPARWQQQRRSTHDRILKESIPRTWVPILRVKGWHCGLKRLPSTATKCAEAEPLHRNPTRIQQRCHLLLGDAQFQQSPAQSAVHELGHVTSTSQFRCIFCVHCP